MLYLKNYKMPANSMSKKCDWNFLFWYWAIGSVPVPSIGPVGYHETGIIKHILALLLWAWESYLPYLLIDTVFCYLFNSYIGFFILKLNTW